MATQPQHVSRIAVIKPCCIGDCVMALPAIDSLRAAYPGATLEVLVGSHSAGVFDQRSGINLIQDFPDVVSIRNVASVLRKLRGSYDLIAVLDRSRLIGQAARLAGCKVIQTPPISPGESPHEIDAYLSVLERAGIPVSTRQPRLEYSRDVEQRVDRLLESIQRPFIAVHPGGAVNPGSIMIQKRWPEQRLIELLNQLSSEFPAVVFTGGTDEARFCQRIAGKTSMEQSVVAAGELNLLETARLISDAALYIGVDTGVSHLAAASGAPSVVIFGPTNPHRYGPRGEYVTIVAPEASYRLADQDLRNGSGKGASISTERVSLDDVLRACRAAIQLSSGAA